MLLFPLTQPKKLGPSSWSWSRGRHLRRRCRGRHRRRRGRCLQGCHPERRRRQIVEVPVAQQGTGLAKESQGAVFSSAGHQLRGRRLSILRTSKMILAWP